MNTKNNQRHQDTIAAIEAVFFSLLKEKELKDISASELCEKAGINRSTFYDNYTDVFEIYFKLGMSKKSADYKTLFFRNGVYAVAKMWFEGGCVEPLEQMGKIIKREYRKAFGA